MILEGFFEAIPEVGPPEALATQGHDILKGLALSSLENSSDSAIFDDVCAAVGRALCAVRKCGIFAPPNPK